MAKRLSPPAEGTPTTPGTVRVLNGRQTSWRPQFKVPGGLHNAWIALAAAEELQRDEVLRVSGCNEGKDRSVGRMPAPSDWNVTLLLDDDGLIKLVPESDIRLATEMCLATLTCQPGADDLLTSLLDTLQAPFCDPFAIRGSEPSPAARHLTRLVAWSCGQAAELIGATAQYELANGRWERAVELVKAGDSVLSAPMLVRHANSNAERPVDTGKRTCSSVDDAAVLLGVDTIGTDCMGRARPTNSIDRAEALMTYTANTIGGLVAGLTGLGTDSYESSNVRARDAAAFGAELRDVRETQQSHDKPSHDDRDAVTRLAEAAERTVGIDEVVTLLLRHSPLATRRLEHQALRGFNRRLDPTNRQRFPDQGRGAA